MKQVTSAPSLIPLPKKVFLIRSYRSNARIKLIDFCLANNVSDSSFKKWLKQYDEGGLESLARADADFGAVLPEGIDRTEESYKREIMKLRIENERLKNLHSVDERKWGKGICTFKAEQNHHLRNNS